MIDSTIITLIINTIVTPILVLATLWLKASVSSRNHTTVREDGFISELNIRVKNLEKEIREVRAELKNRDADYLDLYKEHTTLKAKHEVLLADHEELKKQYENTVGELSRLGNTCTLEHTAR